LLEIHAPLREYVKRIEMNPWYNCDVERAIVKRDIAYRVWKRRNSPADRTRYKKQRKKVNYIISTLEQLNNFFAAASPRPFTSSITPLTTAFPGTTTTASGSSIYKKFSFNVIHQIESNAIGMDDLPIRFLKMILPHNKAYNHL
jgi:hypothetical protein